MAETAAHAVFPRGEAPHRYPYRGRWQDHQDIHDLSAPAGEESAARACTTVAQQAAVPTNDFPSLHEAATHLEKHIDQIGPRAEDALGGSAGPVAIADASGVILEAPGRTSRSEGKDRGARELPADGMPLATQQQASLGLREALLRGPAQATASAQHGVGSPGGVIRQHPDPAISDPGTFLPEGATGSLQTSGAVRDAHTDLAVFYATPQRAAQAAAMPAATPAKADSGNTVFPALLHPTLGSKEQPKAQIGVPKAGPDSRAQEITPAAAGGHRTTGGGEHESIPGLVSATKPHSLPPVLVREAMSEQPSRAPEPPAARTREQAPLPSRRDESRPRLLIHRLDIQIVTQNQPEPLRKTPQPQPAAAPRDAWEGVDRHYFHRLSVSA